MEAAAGGYMIVATDPEPESRYLTTSTGYRLHVRKWGGGTTHCLLIHGFGEGGYVWRNVVDRFDDNYTWFALDLRGHGESEWDRAGHYRVDTHVDDVISVVESLNLRSLIIIGHSLGAEVSVQVAERLGRNVRGLVIVDYGPDEEEEGKQQLCLDLQESLRCYRSIDDYIEFLKDKRFLLSPEILCTLAADTLVSNGFDGFRVRFDPAILTAQYEYESNSASRWQSLQIVNCPTLVVRGVGSALVSRYTAVRMREIFGPASLVQVSMAGHAVMTDNPEGFVTAVRPFLDQFAQAGD
jgi:pimeloyl-ACP methyl ester carboxylesterase